MTPEQQDVRDIMRGAIRGVDREFAMLARDVERIVRLAPEPIDSARVLRELDVRLDRAFGLTQRSALDSDVFRSITRSTDVAAARPYLRLMHHLEVTVGRRDPLLWERIRPRLLGDIGFGPRVATLPSLDPTKPENYRRLAEIMKQRTAGVRLARARSFDPQRRWVPREKWNTKRGYRLSDRVWKQGRVVRRNITMTLKDGIRRGDGPVTIAKRLEAYLNPELAPMRVLQDGRIVTKWLTNRPLGAGHGSVYARTLARTEIMRVHAAATVESARTVPGAIGVKWNISGSHSHADECDRKARQHSEGMGPGEYRADEFPLMPSHPNCICVSSVVHMPADDLVDLIVKQYGDVAA
jgi:hypothetical protein